MAISYEKFASQISFFEFIKDEFTKIKFPQSEYRNELKILNNISNINELVNFLEKYPKLFDLYEGYFQLSTFTIAQYTNFLFDVQKLNYSDEHSLKNYLKHSCLNFENGEPNLKFQDYYKRFNGDNFSKCNFKRAVAAYVGYLQQSKMGDSRRTFLFEHISNNISTRVRIAEYLINQYNLIDYSKGKIIEKTLSLKRHAVDPKTFSGEYGSYRIEKVLKNNAFKELPLEYGRKLNLDENTKLEGFHYVKEGKIFSSQKDSKFKDKVFDFILLKNGLPFFLIETNFYSTSGSKIGINEAQYISLSNHIKDFSSSGYNLFFSWITDGNYWLSTSGMKRWNKIREHMNQELEILNYSLFEEYISKIKNLL